jgi:hypothetical protein
MILFSLVVLYDQWLLPKILMNYHSRRTKLDRIDHALLWTIKVSMLVLAITLPDLVFFATAQNPQQQQQQQPPQEFFFACSGGDIDTVRDALEKNPEWVNSRTENGETPLHLT